MVHVLRVVGDGRAGTAQDGEGDLLEQGPPVESPQRIDVEEDQHRGKHHHARLRGQGEEVEAGCSDQEPAAPAAGRVRHLEIREKREKEEEPREHVAALRRPGDRLGAEGMEHEEKGSRDGPDTERRAGEGRGLLEDAERHEVEGRRARGVHEQARQMVAHGVHAPQDVVEAERHPRERDVVAQQHGREEVPELGHPEPPVRGILVQVQLVVPLDEVVPEDGREHDEGDQRERERDSPDGERVAHQPTQGRHERMPGRP